MQQFFKVKTTRFILGIILACVAFAITIIFTEQIKAGMVFAIFFVIAGSFTIEKDAFSKKIEVTIFIMWAITTAFVTCFLSELVLNEDIVSLQCDV